MHFSRPAPRKYRRDIDGLRAIAVLSVFLYHLQPQLLPGGFLGVDVFFVISGYLISGIIIREHHQQSFSFPHFYARRIKRIFPALFVVLALSALTAIVVMTPETYDNFMTSGRYAAAQLSNFYFSGKIDYFSEGFSGQPLLHTWSLGVEEQFYLFWPLLIFLSFYCLTRNKPLPVLQNNKVLQRSPESLENEADNSGSQYINSRIAAIFFLLALASFMMCYQLTETNYNHAFYMFYTRAFEFCIGGGLALKILPVIRSERVNRLLGATGLILLCYSFLFINEAFLGGSFLQFGVLVPCIGSGLIIYEQSRNSLVNRLISMKFPVYVGKISYSLYLYHWPVIIFWKLFSNNQDLGGRESIIIVLISFLLATLSYLFIEQPVRRSTATNRKTILSALIVIICFSTGFRIMENFAESGWRITPYQPELTGQSYPQGNDCQKAGKDGVTFFQCQDSRQEDTPVIALVGDSHAPHFLRSATSWAKKNGYNVKYKAVPGCPMVLGDVSIQQTIFDEKYTRMCERSLSLFKQTIVEDPLVEIVMIAQRYDLFYDGKGYSNNTRIITFKDHDGRVVDDHMAYYEERLSETVEILKAAGKKVVILKQVPINIETDSCNWTPLLFKLFKREEKCEYDDEFISEWQQPSIDFINTFCQDHELAMFDPVPAMNKPQQNGLNLYRDKDHLSEYGTYFLVPYFEQTMEKILDPGFKAKNHDNMEIPID